MGRQDGGFGGHPVVGVEGQVCEEATEDLPNVWKFFECSEFWNRDFIMDWGGLLWPADDERAWRDRLVASLGVDLLRS